MISISYGTGTATAFLFLIFELMVFPLLSYSTTIVASIFVHRKKRKEGFYFPQPMNFPLWNEGLLRDQKSHICLLLIRVAFIVIPVYLESQLKPRRSMFAENIPLVFLPKPITNSSFLDYFRDRTYFDELTNNSTLVFSRCSRFDEEGWLVASIANVTLLNSEIDSIRCLPQAERKIFQLKSNLNRETRISFQTLKYTSTKQKDKTKYTHMFFSDGISSKRTRKVECFYYSFPKLLSSSSNGKLKLGFRNSVCQETVNNSVSFFYMHGCEAVDVSKSEYEEIHNATKLGSDEKRKISVHANFTCKESIATVEFKYNISITAMHLHTSFIELEQEEDLFSIFIQGTAKILYNKAENYSIEFQGDSYDMTDIPDQVLIIGGTEISVIILLSMLMWYVVLCTNQVRQKPNTLNGLSKIWANYEAMQVNGGKGRNVNCILLKMIPDEEKPDHYKWVSAS